MTAARRLTEHIPSVRFRPPTPQPGSLPRPRLSAAIDAALESRSVAVVSAPSGYGKTTAVADWAAAQGEPAWLLLNALDIDQTRLQRGVIDALSASYRRARHSLPRLDDQMTPRALYAALSDATAAAGIRVTLIVDDAHRAGEHWRRSILGMLVDQPPEMIRVLLIGTTLLDITMSRERLLQPEMFVGSRELRFTADEVAALMRTLNDTAQGRSLEHTSVFEETQGWPIAVRMVLIGGRRPDSGAATASEFLGDYVRDHILSVLPPGIADFVLDTTVCIELTPALAAAVSARPDAAALLDECVALGLFLDRFSGPHGMVYQWHSSFVRTCADIRRADPERAAACHRRAAAFLEDTDQLSSIQHSLLAGDTDGARATLFGHWVALIMEGNGEEVERAVTLLMRDAPQDADLPFILACATDLLGGHHLAREIMTRAEQEPARTTGSDRSVIADIARLFVCNDPLLVSRAATRLRGMLAAGDPRTAASRIAINTLLGWAEIRIPSNPELPAEYFASASREFAGEPASAASVRASGHLAFAQTWAGHLRAAESTLRSIGHPHMPPLSSAYASGSAWAASGFVAYWAGDTARCVSAYEAILQSGFPDPSFSAIARMMIAYSVAETGDGPRSRRAAIGIQEIPIETLHGVPWHMFRESSIALLEETSGNHERAVRIARKYVQCPNLPVVAVAMSGILRRDGNHAEALQTLRSLRLFSEVSYVKAATLMTAAVMRRHAGDHEAAHELCEAGLAVASGENVTLLFAHRETAIRKLLSEHVHFGSQYEDFIGRCLASEGSGSLVAVLSERERDVFRQLQTSRTLPEIADELELSINTVKTHQRAIYRKLGVTSRREAVHTTV
ncbi:LuxR C-terminal-related transcriptional regulator [Microbacterium sp. 3J1]|uniref:LuxR C-terminal-related transcriptional regulator n=1 Tax=Microbacterium sp. 3J1 TaxID=861269 RepID=UPI000B83C6DA|nr:LuxR C-terminal-related transcriptional regulator [Microbacterium sp. 3J1]